MSVSRRKSYAIKLAESRMSMADAVTMFIKRAIDYSVVKGDTVSGIAARNGTTVGDIVKMNPSLGDPNRIRPGQRLRIPTTVAATPTPATVRPAAPSAPAASIAPALSVRTPKPNVLRPDIANMNRVSSRLHKNLNNQNLEAGLLANLNTESAGSFDWQKRENGGHGWGIPQFSNTSLAAYRKHLADNKLTEDENVQLDYFCNNYLPKRPYAKKYLDPKATFTPEQYADWAHRYVFTPAHVIKGNKGYSVPRTLQRTMSQNDFIKNRIIRGNNGVWEGVAP